MDKWCKLNSNDSILDTQLTNTEYKKKKNQNKKKTENWTTACKLPLTTIYYQNIVLKGRCIDVWL